MVDGVGGIRIRGIRKVGLIRLLRSIWLRSVVAIPWFFIVSITVGAFVPFGLAAFEDIVPDALMNSAIFVGIIRRASAVVIVVAIAIVFSILAFEIGATTSSFAISFVLPFAAAISAIIVSFTVEVCAVDVDVDVRGWRRRFDGLSGPFASHSKSTDFSHELCCRSGSNGDALSHPPDFPVSAK